MGLFSRRLDTPEHLRPWRQAGIQALLGPEPAPVQPPARPEPRSGQRPPPRPRSVATPPPRPATEPVSPAPNLPAPETWADPWPGFLAKAPKGCRVVFTYYDLCLDLLGQGRKERGDLWRTLIRAMGWPAGTVAFWPMSAPDKDMAVRTDADMFLAGLQVLGLGRAACFGADALTAFTAEPVSSYTVLPIHGIELFVFPSPAELVGQRFDPGHKLLDFLRRIRVNEP